MVALDIEFETARQRFFDRPGIARKVDKGAREAMAKVGGYIRTTAKRSIRPPPPKRTSRRKGNRSSKPGQPPRAVQGTSKSPLRNKIFFVYDEAKKGVVVGPLLWNAPKSKQKSLNYPSAAGTLEHGGMIRGPQRVQVPGTNKYVKSGAIRTTRIAPRPYMRPALEKAMKGPVKQYFTNFVK